MKLSDLFYYALIPGLVGVGAAVLWTKAHIEAEVFNRYNPDTPISIWEALWTRTRINVNIVECEEDRRRQAE